jgi:hypothetical protein
VVAYSCLSQDAAKCSGGDFVMLGNSCRANSFGGGSSEFYMTATLADFREARR